MSAKCISEELCFMLMGSACESHRLAFLFSEELLCVSKSVVRVKEQNICKECMDMR